MRIFMGIHPRQIQTCCFSIQTFNSNILSCHLNLQLLNWNNIELLIIIIIIIIIIYYYY